MEYMNKSIDEIRVSLDNKSVTSEELFTEAKTKALKYQNAYNFHIQRACNRAHLC